MNYAAVDFESYYDDECSITVLGVDGYILHPKWLCYQVAIVTSTGLEWVGDPADAPWDKIAGDDWEWCEHNSGFDQRVHYYLVKWKKIPDLHPRVHNCTADLCAFRALPRALANASSFLWQEKVSKDYRNRMKGVIFSTLAPEKQADVREAGLIDARRSLRFWTELSDTWPEQERRISRLSRQQSWQGLLIDKPALEQDIQFLKNLKWQAEQLVPWHGVEATLSYPALVAECQKAGIEAPPSRAMASEECGDWLDRYGDQYLWVDAMRMAGRANGLLKKIETMYVRIRAEDGRLPYENKYFGAHTGRWGDGSGEGGRNKSGGFNSRNLPRNEMFGEEFFLGKLRDDGTREVAEGKNFAAKCWEPGMKGINLRHRIIPAPGCHFPIADLSQIEPRVLWCFAGDHESLALVRQGMSPYEVHARRTMGYDNPLPLKKIDGGKYQLSKARVLALGYNAGWIKFIVMAPLYVSKEECERIFSAPVTDAEIERFIEYLKKCRIKEWLAMWAKADELLRRTYINSWKIVMDFRRSNPKIASKSHRKPGLWQQMQNLLEAAIGDDLELGLPSGRSLLYRKIARIDGDITGIVMKYGKPIRMKLYGGLLTENLCQAVSRDVFVECLLRLDDAGHHVAAHIHDEAVPEVPLSVTTEVIEGIMSQAPSWMKSLPVASECESRMFYTK